MTTTKEYILRQILACGSADLVLLDEIKYDLYDIIEYLKEINALNINNIFREVFVKGAKDLKERLEMQKEEIEEKIKEEIKLQKDDEEKFKQALDDLDLLHSGKLNPEEDLNYFLNYIDTYVYMKHIDFYRRWMESEVDDIENNMGWNFGDIDWED